MSHPSPTNTAPGLEPCPWCGGKVQPRWALWISDGCIDSIIHAEPTDCPMQVFEDGSTDKSIVAKWNARSSQAKDDAHAVEIAALKQEITEVRAALDSAFWLCRQLDTVINRLHGQAYSSTVSQLNHCKAQIALVRGFRS
jgi:hypothetical protein